jgi:hypothetical protein
MGYHLRTGVSTAETDAGLTVLDEDSGEYFNLNPTGALVLRVLLDGGTSDGAVERLMAAYDVERETAEADVRDLLSAFEQARLVVDG